MKSTLIFFINFAFLILISIVCKAQSPLTERNKLIAKQFLDAWTNHDSLKLAALYIEKPLYEDLAFNTKKTTKKGIIRYVHDTSKGIPDYKFKQISIVADDSMAVVEWQWTGTFTRGFPPQYPGTNKPLNIRGVSVLVIDNGLIKRSTDYYDWNSFLKSVGLQ